MMQRYHYRLNGLITKVRLARAFTTGGQKQDNQSNSWRDRNIDGTTSSFKKEAEGHSFMSG